MNDRIPEGDEAILQNKEMELMVKLKNREGLEADTAADPGDAIQRAAELAILIEALDRNSSLLREVRAALARIDEGAYGRCLQCDDAISPQRLAAVPWASLCIKCQEDADRH